MVWYQRSLTGQTDGQDNGDGRNDWSDQSTDSTETPVDTLAAKEPPVRRTGMPFFGLLGAAQQGRRASVGRNVTGVVHSHRTMKKQHQDPVRHLITGSVERAFDERITEAPRC